VRLLTPFEKAEPDKGGSMKWTPKGGSAVGHVYVFSMMFLLWPGVATAQETATIDSGDTAWLLTSSALVLLMLPGLGLFYAGMARSKNVLATLMHSFFMIGLISVQWMVIGYTLAFGSDIGGVIGGFDYLFLAGVGMEPNADLAETVPHQAFMMFQGMFAIITPALITGAFAERMKFGAFVVFSLLWATLVYDPIAHWVWGGGFLGEMGALDFAGGTVVHISSGVSALVCAMVLGPRLGWPREPMVPNNLTLTVLGAGLLWFGWFGFNAGSALAADGTAALAFVTTQMAAAAATLGWAGAEVLQRGKASVLGAASGAVAGLVAITPAAGFVSPLAAVVIGAVAGALCYLAVNMKHRLGYDDSLDVVGVHGVGGTWGAIATGIFATVGAEGLILGNPGQVWIQFVSVLVTVGYALVVTFVLLKVVDALVGLRVNEDDEITGLDLSQHGETGYNL
jgi:Amt family ammonium transporter